MRRRVQSLLSMATLSVVTLVAVFACGETPTEPIEPAAALDEVAAQALAAAELSLEVLDGRSP